ncbi:MULTISPECIES: LCP family protein [Bacillota]|uniref:LCP family protein n=3 Tax=Amedibacillus TaxID=2749846 RepID=A0A7G9GM58_9FIRM|nr:MULTISPECIES: LCP family protein [Bacillota]QNM11890.1 LCP family protein [[Eubacterium] hominis]RGB48636.1 LytR family transcriptional regulator [Absiella sp. AM22-9]RGB62087.1 LytR family transcriptional regulator [Absiella sp. AM09-45]RGB62880.1 LytR family transcriptional regulator [Absiella sp. AM10-20]RGB71194.1 LytR family transcriptional regulator [Absiella sp. AM09-50]
MENIKKIGKHVFWIIQLIVSLILTYSVYKLLPLKYLAIVILILAVLLGLVIFMQLSSKTNKAVKMGSKVLAIVLSVLMVFVNVKVINKAQETIDKISNGNIQTTTVSVLVKKDNTFQKIEDLDGKQFGIMKNIDRENTDFMLNRLNEQFSNQVSKTEYESGEEMLQDLLNDKTDAIIMNEGFRDSFNLIDKKFESETKVIYTLDKKKTIENLKSASVTKESFIAYISGIDTSGPITTTSRSDVNMLMAVNPVKKKIGLVFIPRDYYVPLQCHDGVCESGAMDKLTHAGLYGIEVSQATIENILGVDINYNIRINFDTVKTMVDALGGIEIDSDKDFIAWTDHECHIKEGKQHLDGKCALAFARERYSYEAGDRHRGENQQEVIRAMINKMTTTNIIKNYESILNAVQGMFQTNMKTDEITALIQMQINDMTKWDVQTTLLDGTGDMVPTYSYGSTPLYVMRPDTDTISSAKVFINEIIK